VIAIPEGVSPNAKFNLFDYLMPGQLVFMFLSAGLNSVGIQLAQQRQSGTLRHLFSTPLSMPVWLASRVLANLLMGLLQVVILYGVGMAVFKLHLPANLPGTVFMVLLGATTTVGMGLLVGALAKNAEAAFPIALIIYMILSFLGNVMMPLDDFGATINYVMKFMPSYYMTHGLKLVMMQGKGLFDARFDIAVLVVVTVVTMSIATWRLRKQFVAA
jgi:ABC-2 type transport system permease protein